MQFASAWAPVVDVSEYLIGVQRVKHRSYQSNPCATNLHVYVRFHFVSAVYTVLFELMVIGAIVQRGRYQDNMHQTSEQLKTTQCPTGTVSTRTAVLSSRCSLNFIYSLYAWRSNRISRISLLPIPQLLFERPPLFTRSTHHYMLCACTEFHGRDGILVLNKTVR